MDVAGQHRVFPAVGVLQVGLGEIGPGEPADGAYPQIAGEYHDLRHFGVLGQATELAVGLFDLLLVDEEGADALFGADVYAILMRRERIDATADEVEEGRVEALLLRSVAAQALESCSEPQMPPVVDGQARDAVAGQAVEASEAVVRLGRLVVAQDAAGGDGPDGIVVYQQAVDIAHAGIGLPFGTFELREGRQGDE